MRDAFTMINDAWRDAGRSESPHRSSSIWYALGRRRRSAAARVRAAVHGDLRARRRRVGGGAVTCFTPDALRRAVDDAAEAGADEFFLVPTTVDPAELDRTVDGPQPVIAGVTPRAAASRR